MNIFEIVEFVQLLPEEAPLGDLARLTKRCYEIALIENFIPGQERLLAKKCAEMLTAQYDKIRPGELQKANQALFSFARTHGVGSLGWRITEEKVPPEKIVDFIMRPDNRDRLADYFEVIGKQTLSAARRSFIRALIRAHRSCSWNAVMILHGLAAKADPAVGALFSNEEIRVLVRAPQDYQKARELLVNLELLPASIATAPFHHQLNIPVKVMFVIKSVIEDTEPSERLKDLPGQQREILEATRMLLLISLAQDNIQQIYGSKVASEFRNLFSDSSADSLINYFKECERIQIETNSLESLDAYLIFAMATHKGLVVQTQADADQLTPFLQFGETWLNEERVRFQTQLRLMLRLLANVERGSNHTEEEYALSCFEEYKLRFDYSEKSHYAKMLEDCIEFNP